MARKPRALSSKPTGGKLVIIKFYEPNGRKRADNGLPSQMSHAHISMKEHRNIEALTI